MAIPPNKSHSISRLIALAPKTEDLGEQLMAGRGAMTVNTATPLYAASVKTLERHKARQTFFGRDTAVLSNVIVQNQNRMNVYNKVELDALNAVKSEPTAMTYSGKVTSRRKMVNDLSVMLYNESGEAIKTSKAVKTDAAGGFEIRQTENTSSRAVIFDQKQNCIYSMPDLQPYEPGKVITVYAEIDPGETVEYPANDPCGEAPERLTVPDVIGLQETDAMSAIEAQSLTFREDGRVPNSAALGTVLTQTPAVGTQVLAGTPVGVRISTGPEQTVVPDFIDKTEQEADGLAGNAKVIVQGGSTIASGTIEKGRIAWQDIAAGTTVDINKVVNVKLSRGRDPDVIEIPDFKGLKVEEAEGIAAQIDGLSLSLQPAISDPNSEHDTVLKQTPPANTTAPAPVSVKIWPAHNPETDPNPGPNDKRVKMPDLTGSIAEMRGDWSTLKAETVTITIKGEGEVSKITAHSPAANSQYIIGDPVFLTYTPTRKEFRNKKVMIEVLYPLSPSWVKSGKVSQEAKIASIMQGAKMADIVRAAKTQQATKKLFRGVSQSAIAPLNEALKFALSALS